MARGGKRAGAGRKQSPPIEEVRDRGAAKRLIEALNWKKTRQESIEVAGWRMLWDAADLRIRLDVRRYLYDKRDGKATQPIDHGGGGPIKVEIITNVKMPDPHDP